MGVEGTHVRIAERAARATAWTAVTFTNGWTDFGGGYQAMQYRKVGDVVELRGMIGSGTPGASAFTLPTGFRPPANIRFAAISTGVTLGYWEIGTAGTVLHQSGAVGDVVINFSFSTTA
jgi:hypothetical protein